MKTNPILFAALISTLSFAAGNPSPSTPPTSVPAAEVAASTGMSTLVYPGPDGRLLYKADDRGDVIPDFSSCGYMGGGVAIPEVAVRETLSPASTGDDGERIQAALNHVGSMDADNKGQRGAVLLKKGEWRVEGLLKIPSGVVLQGEGPGSDGTIIIATGTKSRGFISFSAPGGRAVKGPSQPILDERVPVGARHLKVPNPQAFHVQELVRVSRPATAAWIHDIGMDMIPLAPGRVIKQWEPEDYTLTFDRIVTAIDSQGITLDVPIVQAIEKHYGGGEVAAYQPGKPCTQAGVERLRLISEYQIGEEKTDQNHAKGPIFFDAALDCWVRDVTALHFVWGISVSAQGRRITIQDCGIIDPACDFYSSIAFTIDGQQVLFNRCYTRNCTLCFVTGAKMPGPNAFVDCLAELIRYNSGPHMRWAVGGLFDNVAAARLQVMDRANGGSGQGWAGTCHVFWNCTGEIICQQPPTGINWAIGCTGTRGKPPWPRPGGERETLPRADGVWESWGTPVTHRSLYLSQLKDRLGIDAVRAATIPEQLSGPITKLLHCRYGSEPVYPACPAPSTATTPSAPPSTPLSK